MKEVSPTLATLINSLPTGGSFQYAHLYQFTLAFIQGGSQVTFSPAGNDPSIMAAWQAHESMVPMTVSMRGTPGSGANLAAAAGRPSITLRRSSGERAAGSGFQRANATLANSSTSGGQGAIYLTDAPIDVLWNGITYRANTVKVDNTGSPRLAHWKRGLDVDSTTVALMPRLADPISGAAYPDLIGSVPFIAAARGGALDGADIQIDRAFFNSWPQPYSSPINPVGTIMIFAGTPVEVDTTDTMVVLTINDYRQLLQNKFPRVHFQLQCTHTLYDVGCTLSSANFSKNGVCDSTSTRQTIVSNSDIAASGSGTFTLGKLTFTSGLNSGFSRTIRLWTAPRTFALLNPVPFTVSAGDTFAVFPGCDKQSSTCTAFGNIANFGGQPFIPDLTTAA